MSVYYLLLFIAKAARDSSHSNAFRSHSTFMHHTYTTDKPDIIIALVARCSIVAAVNSGIVPIRCYSMLVLNAVQAKGSIFS